MTAAELAAVLAPLYAILAGIWRESRLHRTGFASEARVSRGWFASIADAVGAKPPTFPAPPPPRSPDQEQQPMQRFPRILPVLALLLLALPLAGCVASRDGGGFTVSAPASSAEVDVVKEYAAGEVSSVRRELEAADARIRADVAAADEKIRADVVGQVEASENAWTRAVAEGRSFAEAAAERSLALASAARVDAERAGTLATEAGSRSADALKRATESGEERKEALDAVLEEARRNKWSLEDWLAFLGIAGGTTTAGVVGLNSRRNATRAAALSHVTPPPAGPPRA